MIELTYIARPLIGAVIGYITNDIAIRMLFRPRRAKYIFGFRLPFTPGLIPKEKARIAASIGEAVSKNLMNREVLEKTLLSDDITGKLAAAFDDFVAGLKTNTEPVGQLLARYLAPADTEALRSEIVSSLADRIHHAVVAADLGPEIASMAIGHVADKLRGGVPGILGADKVVATLMGPIEKLLAKHISEMVEANSRQMAASLIDEQTAAFMDMPREQPRRQTSKAYCLCARPATVGLSPRCGRAAAKSYGSRGHKQYDRAANQRNGCATDRAADTAGDAQGTQSNNMARRPAGLHYGVSEHAVLTA